MILQTARMILLLASDMLVQGLCIQVTIPFDDVDSGLSLDHFQLKRILIPQDITTVCLDAVSGQNVDINRQTSCHLNLVHHKFKYRTTQYQAMWTGHMSNKDLVMKNHTNCYLPPQTDAPSGKTGFHRTAILKSTTQSWRNRHHRNKTTVPYIFALFGLLYHSIINDYRKCPDVSLAKISLDCPCSSFLKNSPLLVIKKSTEKLPVTTDEANMCSNPRKWLRSSHIFILPHERFDKSATLNHNVLERAGVRISASYCLQTKHGVFNLNILFQMPFTADFCEENFHTKLVSAIEDPGYPVYGPSKANDAPDQDTLLTGVFCTVFGSLMITIAIFCM